MHLSPRLKINVAIATLMLAGALHAVADENCGFRFEGFEGAKTQIVKTGYGDVAVPIDPKMHCGKHDKLPNVITMWNELAGYWLFFPTQAPPAGTRPWIWYAPQSPGDLWIVERLLAAGFAIAGTYPGEEYGNAKCRETFTRFHERVTKECGLDKQASLMPQSRGGLMLYNWAADHPDAVRCVGGIYPVCDVKGGGWHSYKDLCKNFGLSEAEMDAQLKDNNPIDRLAPFAERKVHIFHITGDSDTAVPMDKNSLEMQRRYRALGGDMEVEIIPGKGHQECPEIFHSQRMVDFFLKYGLKK